MFNGGWDSITLLMHIMLVNMSFIRYRTYLILPKFIPNDYLYEQHKDKGGEKWEIYAWAVRHAMARAYGFGFDESTLREKLIYEYDCGVPRDSIVDPRTMTYED